MSDKLYKWRYYCIDEQVQKYINSPVPPTACEDDPNHSIRDIVRMEEIPVPVVNPYEKVVLLKQSKETTSIRWTTYYSFEFNCSLTGVYELMSSLLMSVSRKKSIGWLRIRIETSDAEFGVNNNVGSDGVIIECNPSFYKYHAKTPMVLNTSVVIQEGFMYNIIVEFKTDLWSNAVTVEHGKTKVRYEDVV